MRYRKDRYGNELSQLGFGCMRFTKKGTQIDYAKAEREVLYAMEHGVNYFDTAWAYPGSEECLGRILDENGCRDKVNIATKLPQYMLRSMKAVEKTFGDELARLRTDHVDYYLMHMFTDFSEWERLKEMGIEEWIASRKADGSIRQIGFPSTETPRCLSGSWRTTTGTSARCSTIISMRPARPEGAACRLRPRRGYRSSSWSR
jgi:hypothetical protein